MIQASVAFSRSVRPPYRARAHDFILRNVLLSDVTEQLGLKESLQVHKDETMMDF